MGGRKKNGNEFDGMDPDKLQRALQGKGEDHINFGLQDGGDMAEKLRGTEAMMAMTQMCMRTGDRIRDKLAELLPLKAMKGLDEETLRRVCAGLAMDRIEWLTTDAMAFAQSLDLTDAE